MISRTNAASVPKLKTLPPTAEASIKNVQRAHFLACIWRSALTGMTPEVDPLGNGWETEDSFGGLIPLTSTMQSEIAPAAIMKLAQCD